jgi:hypothetical protein
MSQPLATYIDRGLDHLTDGLSKPIGDRMGALLGADWVESVLRQNDRYRRDFGGPNQAASDPSFLLTCITDSTYFKAAFEGILDYSDKTRAYEIRQARNAWAHKQKFTSTEVLQVLQFMRDLLETFGAVDEANNVGELWDELVRQVADEKRRGQARKGEATLGLAPDAGSGLKPWWQVVLPREDVREDRHSDASFAADLSVVHAGRGPIEYRDPSVFYDRTYLTAGLRALISTAAHRLARTGKGDPVVDLQTNFGGGKTHSLLSLYHLAGAHNLKGIPSLAELLSDENIQELPTIKRAVFVGNQVGPAEVRTMPDGTKIRTVWGDLAYQLAGPAGYALVSASDETGTAPGSGLFSEVLRLNSKAGASSLILIDEFVTFARQLRRNGEQNVSALVAGTLEANVSFIQQLTESASEVEGALVVFSLPSSSTETGSAAAQGAMDEIAAVLRRNEIDAVVTKTVQRIASPWKPADAYESFEIVRRRLFEPLSADGVAARDAVIGAFLAAYRKHENELPDAIKSGSYRESMERSYPIHPELFERLYQDWSSIEKFQRTRGVLRLLAKVVHELWRRQDASPMILTLDEPQVRADLNRYLTTAWDPVVSSDIEGEGSAAALIDEANAIYGRTFMTRRVARAIFLGSAPAGAAPNRGLEGKEIALSCMLPNEKPSEFSGALSRLARTASHLYSDQARYWFALQPTVNRTAEQRKSSIPTDELNAEILRHLDKSLSSSALWREYFGRVHIAPTNGNEVPEEDSVGLVVLGPEWPRVAGGQDSAHKIASDILKDRSGGPRQNRNMLVFLAADEARLAEAREAAGWLLAWQWVCQQADDRVLVLDAAQIRTSQAQRETWTRSLTSAISDAYIWALDPTQTNDAPGIELHEIRLMGGSDLYVRIGKKLAESERLLVKYSGSRLQLLLQEERLKGVWNEHGGVKISALQETFTRFPYMPRIRDLSVLEAAMSDCVSGLLLDSGFGYAEGWDTQKATWHGVRHGVGTIIDRHTGYLLQAEIAKELLPNTSAEADPPSSGVSTPIAIEGVALRRYRARFSTSADNFSRLASDIGQELLPHLAGTPGSSVDIVVEVSALSPQGFSEKVLKTVSQNATELKSDVSEFHD